MRIKLTALAGAVAITATTVACSSTPSTTSGTETWQAKETGAAVVAGNAPPTYHLTFTGPVKATSTWTPSDNNAVKSTATFKTTAGNLTVDADLPDNGNPPTTSNATTCLFVQTLTGTYVVDGSKSTGSFKDATGHGTVKDVFSATMPRLSNGKCNTSDNAQPLAAGAYTTLVVSGPMTVKS